jgi:hypothetical protein
MLPESGEDTALSIPCAEFMLIDGMGHELLSAVDTTVIGSIARVAQ